MARTFTIVVTGIIGISAGASLAESTLLVPFWMEMSPDAFHDWYSANSARLVRFYSPLQILSLAGAVLASIWLFLKQDRGKWAMLIAALAMVAVILLFFVYFKEANAGFVERSIPADQLTATLEVWGRWQWARVALAIAGFFAALVSISRSSG